MNNMKNRQRGRNNGGGKPRPMGGGGGPNRNPNFDGGGNMRPRGNAQQLMEKFLAMARDASAMGDRVAAENYFQHADHYYRVLNARFEQQQQGGGNNNGQQRNNQHGGQRYDRDPNDQGGGQGDNQGYNQGGQNYGQDGNRQDGNRQDFNRNNNNNHNQGNYGGGQNYDRQPHQDAQPQAENYPAPQQTYQPPEQPAQNDQEIGLPPGILGLPEQAAPQPPTVEAGGDEARAPRRRRGRGQGGPRAAAETASQD
jgi:hypothetical protein